MIRKILIGVAVVFVPLAVVVSLQPPTFHIERSVTIKAPAESAYALVNDFHGWNAWSPWEKVDPNMKRSHSGAASGVGAGYAWQGNREVGEGRMTIQKSERPSLVSIELEFLKPFPGTSTATFTFTPVSDGTKVTWAMDGNNTIPGKIAHLVIDMDKILGAQFDQGLLAMKSAAESAPQPSVQATNAAN
jgi:uncharacterized protein YndB with AHSA1/START domain